MGTMCLSCVVFLVLCTLFAMPRAEFSCNPGSACSHICRTALVSVWPLPEAKNGTLASGKLEHGRNPPTNGTRAGKIVMYDRDWQGIYLSEMALRFQREGAS